MHIFAISIVKYENREIEKTVKPKNPQNYKFKLVNQQEKSFKTTVLKLK